jgi:hypothetical protein
MQVEATEALSVIVRWGPVGTAVNGTVVARSARTTFVGPGSVGTNSTAGRGSTLDDACLVGKPPEAARQGCYEEGFGQKNSSWMLSGSRKVTR